MWPKKCPFEDIKKNLNYYYPELGLFTFNFIAPYRKENTYNVEGSLLDKVSCQSMSDLQISISFKKLRSF